MMRCCRWRAGYLSEFSSAVGSSFVCTHGPASSLQVVDGHGRRHSVDVLGDGVLCHCLQCSLDAGGQPVGSPTAHTIYRNHGRSKGMWCWHCRIVFYFNVSQSKRLFPRGRTLDNPVWPYDGITPVPEGKWLREILPHDIYTKQRYLLLDAPTGIGKTYLFTKMAETMHWLPPSQGDFTAAAGPGQKQRWLLVLFRTSLVDMYAELLRTFGFVHYNTIKDWTSVTPEAYPLLIICYPSICKIPSVGSRLGWNIFGDEAGQTRTMSQEAFMGSDVIYRCDAALTMLIRGAPRHLVFLQYQLTEADLAFYLSRDFPPVDKNSPGVTVIRMSEERMWRGRDVAYTTNESVALSILRQVKNFGVCVIGAVLISPHDGPALRPQGSCSMTLVLSSCPPCLAAVPQRVGD